MFVMMSLESGEYAIKDSLKLLVLKVFLFSVASSELVFFHLNVSKISSVFFLLKVFMTSIIPVA